MTGTVFTGGSGLTGFKLKFHNVLMKNELNNGVGAYEISHAMAGRSGYSFGPVQWDLLKGRGRSLFEDILTNSSVSGMDEQAISDITDIVYTNGATFPPGSTYMGLIDSALQSTYGIEQINAAYQTELDSIISHVDSVIDNVAYATDKSFLNTDIAKLFLCDYHNQFYISSNGLMDRFLQGQQVTFGGGAIIKSGTLGVDDLLNAYLHTTYATNTQGLADELRRFSNVVAQTSGYTPSDIDEVKSLFRVATEVIIPQKENIATNSIWQTHLNNFAAAVLDPARNHIVTDLNSTQNLYLLKDNYLSTDVYIDPGRADLDSNYEPNYSNTSLTGSERNDIILGEGGNDTLIGGAGNDVLVGGPEAAGLSELATDKDILDGGEGNDILIGGAGNDTLYSGTGSNWLYGGTNNDTYYITAEAGSTTIAEDTQGSDTYIIHGAPGATVNITDSDGIDTYKVYGGATVHLNGASIDDKLYLNSDTPVTMLFQKTAGQNIWQSVDGSITATHYTQNGNQQIMRMAA
jgi:Ca2+-binding RTX toxin-like protein